MSHCWAQKLGDCSSKSSREHLVSKSLFQEDVVTVKGLPWCKDAEKTIGLANLTGKVLCKVHNENLSLLDSEGAAAFDVFRKMTAVSNMRKKMTRGSWQVKRYKVNGLLLERWFLKTLINLCIDGTLPIGRDTEAMGAPRPDLVEIAYGLRSFENRAGLYSVVRTGMLVESNETLSFAPLIKPQHHIEGGLFTFRGFHYLLFLEQDGPPEPLDGVFVATEDLGNCQLNFHNRRIEDNEKGYLSQVLEISW